LFCSAPLIFPLLGLDVVLPSLKIPTAVADPLRHLIARLLLGGVAALCIRTMRVVEDLLIEHFRIDVPDNLMARRVRTQFDVFRRLVSFAVFVIALGIALTTFDWAKTIGTSVLASAGIVGLAASLAARPTIENLVAGLQIALSEPSGSKMWWWPMVNGVESRRSTPLTSWCARGIAPSDPAAQLLYPDAVENWTRRTADMLAYVYLYLDYTMPIEPLRQEFTRILNSSRRGDE
jgi:hypothetical protein